VDINPLGGGEALEHGFASSSVFTGKCGEAAERPGQARMSFVVEYRFGRGRSAPRDRYPSGRGAQVLFNLLPHPGLPCLATDPALKLQATPIPEDPERTFGRAGALAFPPMDRFTSPVLALSTPARTFVRPVAPYNRPQSHVRSPAGRPPPRWGEKHYAAGFTGDASILDRDGGWRA